MSRPVPLRPEPAAEPHPNAPDLERDEREEVLSRVAPRAKVVHEAIRAEGEEELARPSEALFWSGLAAGLSMGFSLIVEGLLRAHLPDAAWTPLVAKLGYTVGFVAAILGRQQVFTENTLTVVLPLLVRRDAATLRDVLRLWGVVLAANLIGTLCIAWVLGHTGLFPPDQCAVFTTIGRNALDADFGTTLLRAVFGGWLIALMVWLLPMAESSRIFVIAAVTYVVGLAGFSHVLAGSTEVAFLVWTGGASASDYVVRFFVPTLLGNVVGGVSLVAVLNHAQVVAGED